jgi:hypothetical protein
MSDAQDKRLRRMGYKPELLRGETYYCRREAMVGTRFESKVCGTASELDRITVEGKDTMNKVQRQQINPTGN